MATRSKRKRLSNLYDLLEAFPNESVCINHLERQRLVRSYAATATLMSAIVVPGGAGKTVVPHATNRAHKTDCYGHET